jgi:hypothetical protein
MHLLRRVHRDSGVKRFQVYSVKRKKTQPGNMNMKALKEARKLFFENFLLSIVLVY